MPRRKVERSLKEEEEFQRRRREKKAENQRCHRQIVKITNNIQKTWNFKNYVVGVSGTINNNQIIEINNEIGESSSNVFLVHQQIVCTSDSIHDNRVIELNEQIIGESLTNISVRQQQHADYQSRYRSRKKQYHLDINRIDDINEYYIGSMDVFYIHCNAKHFAAEKISNKGNSFHDCWS